MKKEALIGTFCIALLLSGCHHHDYFKNAVAVWSLSDLNDKTTENSSLKEHGAVKFVSLNGQDARESKLRGGDGIAAQFNGNWLDAGQGANDELNLTGKNISILVRVKADMVNGNVPIINKAGSDQNIAYSISINKEGDDVYIEGEIGSDDIGGAHLLSYKLQDDELTKWHDIVFRFNGKKSGVVGGWGFT